MVIVHCLYHRVSVSRWDPVPESLTLTLKLSRLLELLVLCGRLFHALAAMYSNERSPNLVVLTEDSWRAMEQLW